MRCAIQKQVFEVKATDTEKAKSVQSVIDSIFYSRILPVLSTSLTTFDNEHEKLFCEKLEIDLGIIEYEQFADQFLDKLEQVLPQALEQQLSEQAIGSNEFPSDFQGGTFSSEKSFFEILQHFLHIGALPWWYSTKSQFNPDEVLVSVIDKSPDIVRKYFLAQLSGSTVERIQKQLSSSAHGALLNLLLSTKNRDKFLDHEERWNDLKKLASRPSSFPTVSEMRSKVLGLILKNTGLANSANIFADTLSRLDQQIVCSLPARQLILVSRAMQSKNLDIGLQGKEELGDGYDDLLDQSLDKLSSSQISHIQGALLSREYRKIMEEHVDLWHALHVWANGRLSFPSIVDIKLKVLVEIWKGQLLFSSKRELLQVLCEMDLGILNGLPKEELTILIEIDTVYFRGPLNLKDWYQRISSSIKNNDILHANEPFDRKTYSTRTKSKGRGIIEDKGVTHSEKDVDEVLYVNNAGIIIVWPYLTRYFSTLGLVDDKQFVSRRSQERAVQLLYYIQCGDNRTLESNLLLNKVLCGWPLSETVNSNIVLTADEVKETTELLSTVITHWGALKNTSIEGLRSSFFHREGRLKEKDHGWELLVNRIGIDVLLDQIPWGLGTIHLPWMDKTVYAEW